MITSFWSPKGILSTDNSPFTSPTDWMAIWILLFFAMENNQQLANDWFYHEKSGKSWEFHGNSRSIAIIFDWSKMGNWGTGLVLLGGALRTSGRLPDPTAWLGETVSETRANRRMFIQKTGGKNGKIMDNIWLWLTVFHGKSTDF